MLILEKQSFVHCVFAIRYHAHTCYKLPSNIILAVAFWVTTFLTFNFLSIPIYTTYVSNTFYYEEVRDLVSYKYLSKEKMYT